MKEKAMKKTIMILAATLAATAAMAQTNQVLSRNAVGYVRITAQANKFNLYGMPFKSLSGTTLSVGNVLGTNGIPDTTTVLVWSKSSQKYETESFLDLSPDPSMWDPGTNKMDNAEGFWLKSPVTTNFYLMGEVPDSLTAPTNQSTLVHGYQLMSFPYPVSITLSNSALGVAGDNDNVLVYNGTNYVTYTYVDTGDSGTGWYGSGVDKDSPTLLPGQGFWYRREAAGSTVWQQPKPYTWP